MQCTALLPLTGTVNTVSHTAPILQNKHMAGGGGGAADGAVEKVWVLWEPRVGSEAEPERRVSRQPPLGSDD